MQKKKGISLIVLIITIIVMIILATAIIISLNNSGIIQKASEAVDKTNEAQVKQIAQLGWAEAYAEYGADAAKLKAGVKNALTANGLNPDDYGMIVTTNGVTIQKGWLKDGFTVVKGDKVLEIGDSIAYDAGVSTYTAGWKVLGADDDGNLLIMSAANIKDNFVLMSQEGWLNGASLLDTECEVYGYGEGVVGKARSMKVEDVDEITGYSPEPYGKGKLHQYGNEVTYSYNGTTKPAYSSTIVSGTLGVPHDDGFYYYNGSEFVHINDLTAGKNGDAFARLKSTVYYYNASELLADNAKAYSMIFGNDDTYYWLASTWVQTNSGNVNFGMNYVGNGGVQVCDLFFSTGSSGYEDEYGVRAVVTLSSNINFTGSSETGWSY